MFCENYVVLWVYRKCKCEKRGKSDLSEVATMLPLINKYPNNYQDVFSNCGLSYTSPPS